MKKTALILSGLLLSASAFAEDGAAVADAVNGQRPPDAVKGKSLFETPNKCIRCHENGKGLAKVIIEDGKTLLKISTIKELEAKVRNCDVSHKTHWYEDEVLDVVVYLSQKYYNNFPPVAPGTSALDSKGAAAETEVAAQ